MVLVVSTRGLIVDLGVLREKYITRQISSSKVILVRL